MMKIGKIDITWTTIICAVVAVAAQVFCRDHSHWLNQVEADHVSAVGQNLGIASFAKEIVNNWIEKK